MTLRKPETTDATYLADYWFGPQSSHLRASLDISMLGDRASMLTRMQNVFAAMPEQGPWSTLVGEIDGLPAGAVLINNLVPDQEALVHVHIWNPDHRRMGLASSMAWDAFLYFLDSFSLKKLVMQIPVENLPVIELLKSLGLVPEGTFFGKAAPICNEGHYVRFSIDRSSLAGRT
ncbi:MAG TPA: GNAT family N-acetyltransferase [Oligoflexus sp.]|uniref:GNAT family N-acetyltransferase n=1 Tax=Oligoflexus sp. TaxID=1971216 RepID=UPI002D38AC03|nr:GNAT family N-acetyltransferase [Oligoflexus sp.]HYX34590.1 GNAT family N-acetyltransferase [Oligoflexus sp.]